jgi:hypothetical protein
MSESRKCGSVIVIWATVWLWCAGDVEWLAWWERRVEDITWSGAIGHPAKHQLRVLDSATNVLRISSPMQDRCYCSHRSFGRSTKAEYLKLRVSLTTSSKLTFGWHTRVLDLQPWQGIPTEGCTRASNRTWQPELDPFLPPKVCPGTCQCHMGMCMPALCSQQVITTFTGLSGTHEPQ